jgi:hypothetical protein
VGDLYAQSNGANGKTLWRKRFATAGTPPVATRGWALMQGALDVMNVKDFGAVGDGTTDDTAAFAAAVPAAQAAHATLIIPQGTYAVASVPNLGPDSTDNFAVIGVGGRPVIRHTGSGVAVEINGDPTNTNALFRRSHNIRVENITIIGNNNTTIGFRFRHSHHGIFRNLRVMQASPTGTAYRLEHTILSLYENLVSTLNEENSGATMPKFGIVIANSGGANTQGNTFINPIIEGLKASGAIGIHIMDGARNWFYGGSSENNTKNIQVESASTGNTFNGMYLEDAVAASPIHVTDHGRWTHWINCRASAENKAGEDEVFNIEGDAIHTVIVGGEIPNLVIKAGAQRVFTSGVTVTSLSESGTNTTRLGVYDEDAGVYVNNILSSRLDFGSDTTFDIGTVSAGRPRDVFVGRLLRLDGAAPAIQFKNTVPNGTVATTLGSTGPTGSTPGAPRGWLPVSIDGVPRFIPFW